MAIQYTWHGYQDAAAALGISERALRRAVQQKKISFTKFGTRTLFSDSQLSEYVEAHTNDASGKRA